MTAKEQYHNRRQLAPQERKLSLLKAAGECFAEHGYRRTPVEIIAKRGGVSRGLVFSFFSSKQQLFEAVIDRSLAHWANLSERKTSTDDGNVEEELKALFLASFDLYEQHPVVLLFFQQSDMVRATHKESVSRQNRLWRKRIGDVLNRGIAQDIF